MTEPELLRSAMLLLAAIVCVLETEAEALIQNPSVEFAHRYSACGATDDPSGNTFMELSLPVLVRLRSFQPDTSIGCALLLYRAIKS